MVGSEELKRQLSSAISSVQLFLVGTLDAIDIVDLCRLSHSQVWIPVSI